MTLSQSYTKASSRNISVFKHFQEILKMIHGTFLNDSFQREFQRAKKHSVHEQAPGYPVFVYDLSKNL